MRGQGFIPAYSACFCLTGYFIGVYDYDSEQQRTSNGITRTQSQYDEISRPTNNTRLLQPADPFCQVPVSLGVQGVPALESHRTFS